MMKKSIFVFFCLLICSDVFAKDLSGLWGAGFNQQLRYDCLSVRHWRSAKMGEEGLFGFRLGEGGFKDIDLGGKILYVLIAEERLNVYATGGLGLSIYKESSVQNTEVGIRIVGGLGVEYFFQGLENLGFGAELNLGYSDFGFSSFGVEVDAIGVGIHYYFKGLR